MRKGINPRNRWEIILDILRVISEEEEKVGRVKKTRVMQKAYLDWRNFKRYFDFLVEQGFVGNSDDLEVGKTYYLAEEGKELMKRLWDVEDILRRPTTTTPKKFIPEGVLKH